MPSYPDFISALSAPALRVDLGLHLPDYEADLLLARPEWAKTYYRQWMGETVTAEVGAPIATPRPAAKPVLVLDELPPLPAPASSTFVPLPVVAEQPRRRRRLAVLLGAAAAVALLGGVAAATLTPMLEEQTPSVKVAGTGDDTGTPTAVTGDGAPATGQMQDQNAPLYGGRSLGPAQRALVDAVKASLDLPADGNASTVPGLVTAIDSEIIRTGDTVCITGIDDATARRVASALTDRGAASAEGAAAVSAAYQRYCAAIS